MTVPYHTHNFELPIAERKDILAGAARDKVAVPASLGSAAAADKSEFATAAQGAKADSAALAAASAGEKAEAAAQAAAAEEVRALAAEKAISGAAAAAQAAAEQAGIDAAGAAGGKLNNDFSRGDGAKFAIADGKILGFSGGRLKPVEPPAGGAPSADAGNLLKTGADGRSYLAPADIQQAVAAYIAANKDSLKKELGGGADVNLTVGWQ